MTGTGAGEWIRPLGNTGLRVTAACVGGAPLGSMPENFGYEVAQADGVALVETVLASPIRFLDTANGYSGGASEERIGEGIQRYGGLPPDFLVATKVDARDGDYSGDRVRMSVEESKRRLAQQALPLVYLHDPENFDFDYLSAPGGAVEALVRLREEGVIGHVGLAGGDVHEMSRYLELGVFEVLLVHNRWTLVDRSAGELIARALSDGIAVVNAAVFGGGLLARPSDGGMNYGYRPARQATLDAVARMAAVCEDWGTDLPTAAMAYSFRDPRITSTIVGISKPSRIDNVMAAWDAELPDAFWRDMETLRPAQENWLDFAGENA
jgi:D-threo-aldose 1-dehydrogenase